MAEYGIDGRSWRLRGTCDGTSRRGGPGSDPRRKLAVPIPVLQAIADILSAAGTDVQATTQYFANPASGVRIVVFGHTHDAKLITTANHTDSLRL